MPPVTDALPRRTVNHPVRVLVFGIALIVLGVLAIVMPHVGTLAVELVIAALFLLSGVVYAWSTLSMRGVWNVAGTLIVAILSFIVGALLFLNPMEGVLTLTLLMIAFFFASGLVKLYYAVRNRAVAGWGWGVASGLASIAVGALVLLGWPTTAVWALGLLLGIDLLITGISLVGLYPALRQRAAQPQG